jgi:hypothetical protein
MATLMDFNRIIRICGRKQSHYLELSKDLSEKERKWLNSLVWIKRIHQENHCSDHDSSFIYPSEGMVTSKRFDLSASSCSDGLHVTFLANHDAFQGNGTLFLFVQIPCDIDFKENKLDITKKDQLKKEEIVLDSEDELPILEDEIDRDGLPYFVEMTENKSIQSIEEEKKVEITSHDLGGKDERTSNKLVTMANILDRHSGPLDWKLRVQYLNVLGEKTWQQLEIMYLPSFYPLFKK